MSLKFLHYELDLHGENGPLVNTIISKNQPKCNHSICDYMQLSLGVFTTIRSNFTYFGHCYNYDTTIANFILLIRWF